MAFPLLKRPYFNQADSFRPIFGQEAVVNVEWFSGRKKILFCISFCFDFLCSESLIEHFFKIPGYSLSSFLSLPLVLRKYR